MSIKDFLNQKILVTQIKSSSKLTVRQKSNLIGLGLRGINSDSILVLSNDVFGMVQKVNHVISVKLS